MVKKFGKSKEENEKKSGSNFYLLPGFFFRPLSSLSFHIFFSSLSVCSFSSNSCFRHTQRKQVQNFKQITYLLLLHLLRNTSYLKDAFQFDLNWFECLIKTTSKTNRLLDRVQKQRKTVHGKVPSLPSEPLPLSFPFLFLSLFPILANCSER